MFIRILTVLFISVSILFITLSQERWGRGNFTGGTVTGKILDSLTHEPMEYANVVIISTKDSSVITGAVTNKEGIFNITGVRPGKLIVEVRFIGYHDKGFEITLRPESMNVDFGEIYLKPAAVNLDDVVVEGERSPVSYQIDKKVIDVSQMPTVISGNAADVLENVPSVTVDIEGNVSLRGSSNFTVLIDGRLSVLDAQDALQQIAANTIDKIEIITNPSAKYDPEGTAGIVNIILKKSKNSGWSGIANANAGLNQKYGGDFLFEYKNQIFKTTFGLDYNRRFYPGSDLEENTYFRESNTSFVNSDGDTRRGRINYQTRGGIEFYLSENDVLSFSGRYGKREGQRFSNQNYSEWTDLDPQTTNYISGSDRERSGIYYSLVTNYMHKLGLNGHQLLGELFFSRHNSDEFSTTAELYDGVQLSGRKTTETGPSMDLRGKIDYTLPLNEFNKFEAGYQAEIDLSEEDNGLYEYNPDTKIYEFQPLYSNKNKYNRNEHAFYSLYSESFYGIQLQGGLRTEYTYRKIEVPDQNQKFTIDRWDFFPSIHSSYKLESGEQIMASYSRRIERPRGWTLEPFDTWIDANNVRRGNPSLLPEFIDSYEAGFQTFFGELSLSAELYYRINHNKIERIRSTFFENVILTTFENVGTDYSLGSEFLINFNPFSIWNINLMGNVYIYRVEGVLYDEPFSRESFNWRVRFNNILRFGKSTQLQLNFNYRSPTVSSQGRWEGYFSTDLAVKQEVIVKTLALTLQIRDVLGTAKYEYTNEGLDFYSYRYATRESPVVMLSLRYTFNNFKPERERPGNGENGGFEGGEDF